METQAEAWIVMSVHFKKECAQRVICAFRAKKLWTQVLQTFLEAVEHCVCLLSHVATFTLPNSWRIARLHRALLETPILKRTSWKPVLYAVTKTTFASRCMCLFSSDFELCKNISYYLFNILDHFRAFAQFWISEKFSALPCFHTKLLAHQIPSNACSTNFERGGFLCFFWMQHVQFRPTFCADFAHIQLFSYQTLRHIFRDFVKSDAKILKITISRLSRNCWHIIIERKFAKVFWKIRLKNREYRTFFFALAARRSAVLPGARPSCSSRATTTKNNSGWSRCGLFCSSAAEIWK